MRKHTDHLLFVVFISGVVNVIIITVIAIVIIVVIVNVIIRFGWKGGLVGNTPFGELIRKVVFDPR